MAWDLRRSDWRTFRLDRLSGARLAGGRFEPRDIPGGDAAAYVASSIASIPRDLEAIVAVHAPYEDLTEALSWVDHNPIDTEADSCTVRLRANRMDQLVMAVVRLARAASVRVIEPRSVADEVDALVGRLNQG